MKPFIIGADLLGRGRNQPSHTWIFLTDLFPVISSLYTLYMSLINIPIQVT